MTANDCCGIENNGIRPNSPAMKVSEREEFRQPTRKGVTMQSLAAFVGSLSVLMCGNAMGWITPILVRLLGPKSEVPMSNDESSWVISFIELGNLFSPIPAGVLVDRWGRKPLLLSTAPMYVASWAMILCTRSVPVLYAVRIIQGFGMGVVFTVLPMYLGEIAEPKIRGLISTFFQGMWYTGILMPYCVGPYVSYQCLNYVMSVTPIVFLGTFVWMPESPYFLIIRKRRREALEVLGWLRGLQLAEVIEEMESIEASVEEEMKNKVSWTDLFATRVDRRALLIVMIVSTSEIASGITAVLSYASETFSATDDTYFTADQYTIIMGVLIFGTTFVAAAVVDSIGRRHLLLLSSVGCAFFNLLAGMFFYIEEKTKIDVSEYSWVAFATITSYCVLLSIGMGPLTTTVQAEFFPSNTRGLASGFTAMAITVFSFASLKMYEVISDGVGIFLNYLLYSFFCVVASILIYVFVPETKGKTLADIQRELQKKNSVCEISLEKNHDISLAKR